MTNETSIAAKLAADVTRATERAQREADSKMRLAVAFDAANAERGPIPAPWFIHAHTLYGRAGSLSYKDQTPEDVRGLLAKFPPVASGVFRGRDGTSYRMESSIPADEADKYAPNPDAVALKMDGGLSYGTTVRVEWFAELAPDLIVEFQCELRPIYQVVPQYRARIRETAAGSYIEAGSDTVYFPLEKTTREAAVRYAAGDSRTSYRPRIFTGARAMVEAWAAELDRLGIESRAAYERDKAAGGVMPSEYRVESYDSQKLRAGTRAQHDSLNSPAALLDRGLASKHWRCYAAEHGLDAGRYGFDHYAWACAWLARRGLLIDQNGPNGKPHKYGSAWL